MNHIVVFSEQAPAPVGSYSQAVKADNLVFVSGQLGLHATGELEKGVEAQTRQALKNLEAVLKAGGSSLGSVVKLTVYVDDLDNYGCINDVFDAYFGDSPPARELVEVAGIPKGAAVEVSAIGVATR